MDNQNSNQEINFNINTAQNIIHETAHVLCATIDFTKQLVDVTANTAIDLTVEAGSQLASLCKGSTGCDKVVSKVNIQEKNARTAKFLALEERRKVLLQKLAEKKAAAKNNQ